jgi:predicted nucleotidyltransferase component of viral defense system
MSICFDVVQPDLVTLLKRLMSMEFLWEFYLVGDTALALRLGQLGMEQTESSRNTVRGYVDGIKLECIAHQYPLLEPMETIEGIRMASLKDLAAFKGNAIANRGAKKDFWDLHSLLKVFSREEILSLCGDKYQGESVWNLEKSLVFFDDADLDPDPRDFQGRTWPQIKRDLMEDARRGGFYIV